MKRVCAIFAVCVLMFSLLACTETDLDVDTDVTLNFVYGDKNIHVTLNKEEADKVITILDGKAYDPVSAGVPSCGFDKNISLKVGDQSFAIACDTCNYVQDLGNLRFFSISKEDMAYIHALYETYGGYFPCI